jgi:hypothetical protein
MLFGFKRKITNENGGGQVKQQSMQRIALTPFQLHFFFD